MSADIAKRHCQCRLAFVNKKKSTIDTKHPSISGGNNKSLIDCVEKTVENNHLELKPKSSHCALHNREERLRQIYETHEPNLMVMSPELSSHDGLTHTTQETKMRNCPPSFLYSLYFLCFLIFLPINVLVTF